MAETVQAGVKRRKAYRRSGEEGGFSLANGANQNRNRRTKPQIQGYGRGFKEVGWKSKGKAFDDIDAAAADLENRSAMEKPASGREKREE